MAVIKFMGNAGSALIVGAEAWVVDGLQDGASNYESTPEDVVKWLQDFPGQLNFVVTHNHLDHFSGKRFGKLSKLRSFHFYAFDYDLIDEMRRVTDLGDKMIHYLRADTDYDLGNNMEIRGIVIPHLSPDHYPLKHVSPLFSWWEGEENKQVFLTADANFDEEVYRRNGPYIHGVSVCVAVYAYGFTKRNIAFVDRYIDPGLLILNHLPHRDRDRQNTRDQVVKYAAKNLERPYHIFLDSGEEISL